MAINVPDIDEIPINQDIMTRYVAWIMALLVYLLCLVLTGAVSINLSLNKWQVGVNHRLTAIVPFQHELDRERLIPPVLSLLKSTPGIKNVVVQDGERGLSMAGAWLNYGNSSASGLPPTLIDIDMDPNHPINMGELGTKLYRIIPGVQLETQSRWQETIAVLRTSLQVIAYIFAALIALTVIITITLVTQSGLAAHHEAIRILRFIGAHNSYIARKFQGHALKLAFRGSLVGFLASLPTLIILSYLCTNLGVPELLKPGLDFTLLLVVVTVPATVVFLSICVARFAVFKALARLC
jgi:cell division transport system permease protein